MVLSDSPRQRIRSGTNWPVKSPSRQVAVSHVLFAAAHARVSPAGRSAVAARAAASRMPRRAFFLPLGSPAARAYDPNARPGPGRGFSRHGGFRSDVIPGRRRGDAFAPLFIVSKVPPCDLTRILRTSTGLYQSQSRGRPCREILLHSHHLSAVTDDQAYCLRFDDVDQIVVPHANRYLARRRRRIGATNQ